jgi:hypothetical protein
MFARSFRKLLSVAVVAAAAFVAVNLASPSQARADHRSHGHSHHGHNSHYRGAHGGHGHYSHRSYHSGYSSRSFNVQIAPPIYRYGGYGGYGGYGCSPSYGYGSYVRPGLSLQFGF